MLRRLPVVATLVVLVAVGIMVRLGFWQLDRLHQKEEMLARYEAAQSMSSEVPWPRDAQAREAALYRHTTIYCANILALNAKAGRNDQGVSGWVHVARCALAGGGEADVVAGWTSDVSKVHFSQGKVTVDHGPDIEPIRTFWSGAGEFRGIIAPAGKDGVRLVASAPAIGLGGNAMPNPADIPNNHLSYAVQWFLFAATALVIYALAVRKRLRES
jgi:surfeit locus 1 family protein